MKHYTSALQDYIAGGGEVALQRAYELGRQALADGLGVLEMTALHHEALLTILGRPLTPEEHVQTVKAAENFFVESLSLFEMTHRSFREANAVLHRLNEMLEEEAKRIAHALHDEAGQFLAVVHIELKEVADELPPRNRERLQYIRKLLDQIEAQLRRLSHELRPTILDDLGLLPALEFLAQGVSKRTGILISLEGSTGGRLPPLIETALYRSVQEALTNAAKHAQPRDAQAIHVGVQLQREARVICCCIKDDGVGFDVPVVLAQRGERGLGLIGIRERLSPLGGTFRITSTPGQGTELSITIPLETSDENSAPPRR